MNILIALLVLSVIVIIHEFGHFIVAKANGIGVTEFSLGMGPTLLHWKKGETLYSIRLLLIGGYCMMVGQDGEDEDAPNSFESKSVWARISAIAAGPIFNFLLAFVLGVILIANAGYQKPVVYQVEEGSAAYEAGLRKGDVIKKINGGVVTFAKDYSLQELAFPSERMTIVYEREGERYTTVVSPIYYEREYYRVGISVSEDGTIASVAEDGLGGQAGLMVGDQITMVNSIPVQNADEIVDKINENGGNLLTLQVLRGEEAVVVSMTPKVALVKGFDDGLTVYAPREEAGPLETIAMGFHEVRYNIQMVLASLRMLFHGDASVNDLSGPVGVVSMIGDVVEESKPDGLYYVVLNLLSMALMLSANLGVMNLLPLPALDGGRLVFLFIEAITRKKVPKEKEGLVHLVGIVLLMLLMVYVTAKDILSLF